MLNRKFEQGKRIRMVKHLCKFVSKCNCSSKSMRLENSNDFTIRIFLTCSIQCCFDFSWMMSKIINNDCLTYFFLSEKRRFTPRKSISGLQLPSYPTQDYDKRLQLTRHSIHCVYHKLERQNDQFFHRGNKHQKMSHVYF